MYKHTANCKNANRTAATGIAFCQNGRALQDEFPDLYDRLIRIAAGYLNRERSDHHLQPEELVHEAYLRLLDQKGVNWQNPGHISAIATKMINRILIDYWRTQAKGKRGGGTIRVSPEEAMNIPNEWEPSHGFLADCLENLAVFEPDLEQLIRLRFFWGFSVEEVSDLLEISTATVARRWRKARAWIRDHLIQNYSFKRNEKSSRSAFVTGKAKRAPLERPLVKMRRQGLLQD